jgi:hypothetical protein
VGRFVLIVNPWLGAKRGHLSDWTTQQWVRRTGRRVDLREEAWLDGPYSAGRPRLAGGPCVKTVFPLPNGYAAVFLVPAARADGSFELLSPPGEFGAPGFYFVVRDEAAAWSRTVAAMTEHIHVYVEGGELHADHALRLWGRAFLRLHYAMQRGPTSTAAV